MHQRQPRVHTTLEIDDDPIAAADELVPRQGAVAGLEPFAAKPGVVTTNDQVNALRDSEGV